MIETELSIGYVQLEISCFDNDEAGPGFTDTVDGESDLSELRELMTRLQMEPALEEEMVDSQ